MNPKTTLFVERGNKITRSRESIPKNFELEKPGMFHFKTEG